ncbi:dUTP diphosphatase [Faecalibaculum rodentium]|uniref:dUTP diphosphatase n=1 Tax=Faecalibaculum rodentium TaxID=1702221 RepID=UPI00272D8155|nr:dUTP diphosphatase [Faecalibaculum rodentium]
MTKEEFIAKWNHMLQLQRKLDERIIQGNGLTYEDLYNSDRYQHALLDELGELNHELKANWCWWKKTQAPEDRDEVLEELADVWHFALMIILLLTDKRPDCREAFLEGAGYPSAGESCTTPCDFLRGFIRSDLWLTENTQAFVSAGVLLTDLTRWCGFTIAEIHKAYKKKNAVNFQRIQEGY